jgi:glycosyltransferase involved in cell wall biosynthesis
VKDTPSEPPFTFPYFLYFGRLESRKNLVFLIEAFSRYRRDGGKGHLILMGPIERAYDKVLYRAIRREGLEAIVHLLAPVYGPDKTRYLKHSVAVIYPAVEEPFGRVPFESVAAGTFPLVPVESGSAEYLAPYLSGCLYPIEDKDALVSCMREIEQLSSVQRTKHLAAARSWVEKKLNWETVCAQVLGVYQSVLAESQSVLAQHTNLGRKNENPMPSMP